MWRYIIRRLLLLIPVLFGITFLSFAVIQLAGSDAVLQKADAAGLTLSQEVIEAQRAELGLDRPFLIQYLSWLGDFLRGDLGVSYVTGNDVFSTFVSRLPATLLLTGMAVLLTVAVSVPLGILAAVRQNRFTDYLIRVSSFIGNSLPNFLVAIILMYLFSIRFPVFPVVSDGAGLKSAVLPAVTLAIAMSSKYVRQVRAAVLDELGQEYVLGEKARGIRFSATLWKSVMRACLVTILTLLALSVGSLLGGTAVVETIFMWDGVGKLAADAIQMRDYPLIQAYVVWMAVIYVGINLVTDILYHILDPRIRLGGEEV
ncbi:MAG TPA: ABC transporter permease [Candidatus Mediterraneibacter stercoripullorum]|nr:ABC transporter permease [Candidatus Mediterraneibacter stercoripullorum]